MIWHEKNSVAEENFLDNLKNEIPSSSPAASNASSANETVAKSPAVSGQADESVNFLSNPAPTDVTDVSQNPEAKPEEDQSQKTDSEADLEVYKDTEDNYELKYSQDVSVSKNGDYLVVSQGDNPWRIKVYSNNKKRGLQDWFDKNFSEKERLNCTFSASDVKIGNYETEYASPGSGDTACAEDGYYALNSDKTKVVRVKIGKETVDNVNKILATFKFD